MYAVAVLISTAAAFLVTDAQAQSTVGDSCSELCGKYEDELEKCTERQDALAGKINRTSQELSEKDERLRIANDKLQRKEKCEKTEQENCTTQGSHTVCFRSSMRLGAIPKEFNDFTILPKEHIEKVFITMITMYTRIWGADSLVIGAIAVTYNTSATSFTHGDASCRQANATTLKLEEGDKITNITARFGDMIDGLTFYTRKGRVYGPYGGAGGVETAISPPEPDGYLAYVKGSTTTTYDCVGIRYLDFVWGYEKSV